MADPRDELAEIAAREARAAQDKVARVAASEREAAARAQREQAAAAAREAAAPTGFTRSMRFFYLMAMLLMVMVTAIAGWSEAVGRTTMRAIAASAGGTLALLLLAWVDSITWRRRLPFALEGYDHIAGSDSADFAHAAFVELRVEIVLRQPGDAARTAARSALVALAARANKATLSDKETRRIEASKLWRADDLVAVGHSAKLIYTTRLLERWLRREMRLVARVAPDSTVKIAARYSGRFWSTDAVT